MEVKTKLRIKCPSIPNNLIIENTSDERDNQCISIAMVEDESLIAVAEEWKRLLLMAAKQKRDLHLK